MRRTVLLLLTLSAAPVPLGAQLPLQRPAPSVLFRYGEGGVLGSTMTAERSDSVRRHAQRTAWKEGALVGGAVGALAGIVLGNHLCGLANESARGCTGSMLVAGALSAVIMAIPGALIGGQISKPERGP